MGNNLHACWFLPAPRAPDVTWDDCEEYVTGAGCVDDEEWPAFFPISGWEMLCSAQASTIGALCSTITLLQSYKSDIDQLIGQRLASLESELAAHLTSKMKEFQDELCHRVLVQVNDSVNAAVQPTDMQDENKLPLDSKMITLTQPGNVLAPPASDSLEHDPSRQGPLLNDSLKAKPTDMQDDVAPVNPLAPPASDSSTIASGDLLPGSEVRIRNLLTATHLNGRYGKIRSYNKEKDRFIVDTGSLGYDMIRKTIQLRGDGRQYLLKKENLQRHQTDRLEVDEEYEDAVPGSRSSSRSSSCTSSSSPNSLGTLQNASESCEIDSKPTNLLKGGLAAASSDPVFVPPRVKD